MKLLRIAGYNCLWLPLFSMLLVHCGGSTASTTTTTADDTTEESSTSTFTVGGTVSGLSGTLVLQNNSGDDLSLTANGSFTFATSVADGANYVVTVLTNPTSPTQVCTASSNSGTVSGANVTTVTVTCSTNAYTVGGTVSGLSGTLVLQNNSTDDLTLTANGSFTFATSVAEGAGYTVTVATQPANQACTVSSGTGTATANVTNITVSCTGVPVVGNSGTLTASALTTVSYTVSWTAGTDTETAQASLQYLLYRSTTNNLDTVANIEANGTAVGSFTANDTTTDLTDLSPNTTYFFNVIVKDADSNKTAYTSNSQATTSKMYLFAEGTDRDADLKTAGLLDTARASGDRLCASQKTAAHSSLNCTNIRAFITIDAADEIRDFPTNYGTPTTAAIHSSNDTKLADNWDDLLDGTIDETLGNASVYSGFGWWSGSTESGALNNGDNCSGYTITSGSNGTRGQPGFTDTNWIERFDGSSPCSSTSTYLCLCW